MKENAVYNDFLNSSNIIIGMSGGEGWGLPEFQSLALGKHAVLLNAHSYQSWANKEMAVMVEPKEKISSVDGRFFQAGQPFNQGSIYDWDEESFITACEQAIERVKANPINLAGASLQQTHSKEKFLGDVTSFLLS
jgi:hypothetical protein